ncbi:unnamed protein product [Orchesella dallaii]|uniref:DUF4789 domain-containing protein n=1 Tax=Orchesella dallaii TaxID=48710 RepID=A0ABP1R0F9_9HEXA
MNYNSHVLHLILGFSLAWSTSSQPLAISDADPTPKELSTRIRRADEAVKTPDILSPDRLCPEGSAFHNDTNCCHKLLEQGPCGDLQLFYQVSKDSNYGTCACMANPDGCSQLVKNNRMILPAPDSKQCYMAFSQGPCQVDEWFVLDLKSLQPQCQKNPCSSPKTECDTKSLKPATTSEDSKILKKPTIETDLFDFTMKDQCYKTFTQGPCPEGQFVQFVGTLNPYPKCFRSAPPTCMFSIGTSAGLPCEAGHKLVGDDCVPIVEFE